MRRFLLSAIVGLVSSAVWWSANRLLHDDATFSPTWLSLVAGVSFGVLWGFVLADRGE